MNTDGLTDQSVRDTGIGIPENRQAELFHSFFQVDNSISRRLGGSGLGLVISKRLCELMGGQVALKSREGEGSTFSFTIPFIPALTLEGKEITTSQLPGTSAAIEQGAIHSVANANRRVVFQWQTTCQFC